MKRIAFAAIFAVISATAIPDVVSDGSWVNKTLEEPSEWHEGLLSSYIATKDEAAKGRLAFSLSRLWSKGILQNKDKDYLTDHYYKVRLIQYSANPELHLWLWADQTFPFPNTTVEFRTSRIQNGTRQRQQGALTDSLSANNLSLQYEFVGKGGARNGDKICYEVTIVEKRGEKTIWERTLVSNQIVVQGLKE
jgi:hypothetical protein